MSSNLAAGEPLEPTDVEPTIPEFAYEAYMRYVERIPPGQPVPVLSYEDALKGGTGDTLGDFVVIELYEGLESTRLRDPNAVQQAIHLVERARDELGAVEDSLRKNYEDAAKGVLR